PEQPRRQHARGEQRLRAAAEERVRREARQQSQERPVESEGDAGDLREVHARSRYEAYIVTLSAAARSRLVTPGRPALDRGGLPCSDAGSSSSRPAPPWWR